MHLPKKFAFSVVLGLLLSSTHSVSAWAATAPVAYNQSLSVLENSPHDFIKLAFVDPDTNDSRLFTLVSAPVHGTVLAWTGTYTPLSAGTQIYTPYWYYAPNPGYTGLDSFKWNVFDGTYTSNTATCSVTVRPNAIPAAKNAGVTLIKDTTNTFPASFVDSDPQAFTLTVVSTPTHGTVSVTSDRKFIYTPAAGYTGTDSFTWKVSDGIATSSVATCSLLVRSVNSRAGMLVALVVNDLLLPEIQAEVTRLKSDLIAEGYTAKILTLPGSSSATAIWNCLQTEYRAPGQFMSGAILIGGLATTRNIATNETTDCAYWNMDTLGDTSMLNIWVSRIWAQGNGGLSFGTESTLIKRALQANHDYRTGASRLPHAAYHYDIFSGTSNMANFLSVWPTVEYLAPEFAFTKGGELIHETSHGGPGAYSDKGVMHSCGIHDRLAQVRFALCTSCVSGSLGGVVNNQLLTRGGGNVLSIGATEVEYAGAFNIVNNTPLLGRLAAGDSWGNSLVTYPFSGDYRTICYGDLSIGVKASPPNQLPVVGTLTASVTSGVAPLPVNFSATASDPDGTITNWEWFPTGHYYGKASPSLSGPTATSASFTFTQPYRYLAHVEVTDNFKARAWKEVEIRVAPQPGQPLRINCGRALGSYSNGCYSPDLEYVDSAGRRWLHDQIYALGTWGTNGLNANVAPFSGDVLGTTDDLLYLDYTGDYYGTGITYTIPLANGGYTVKFGFCDMRNTVAGKRLADISIEGAPVHTAFDIVGTFGAKTPGATSHHLTLTDGVMQVFVKTNPAGTGTGNDKMAIINTLEVIPDGGTNSPPVASNQSLSTSEDTAKALVLSASDPEGSPLTYAVVTPPAHGTLSGSAQNLTYTPAANFNGADTFTFRANDGLANSNLATVSFTVTAVNDAPVANPQTVNALAGVAKAIVLSAADVEGSALTYSIASTPAHGTLTGTAPNLTYTAVSSYAGSDSFTFKASDGALSSIVASVSLNVSSVSNQAPKIDSLPWANPNPVQLPSATTVHVVASDPDSGPAALVYTWTKVSGLGTVTFSPNGTTASADSTANFTTAGSYVLRVTISDGAANISSDLPITAQPGTAVTMVLQDGLNGYTGTRDSFLYGYPGNENYNKGALTYFYLATNMTPVVRFSIFQAAGGPLPNSATIQTAKLSIYKYSAYNYTFQARRLLKDWKELEATWIKANTATSWSVPGATGSNTDILSVPDGQSSIDWAPGWLEIDVTASVKAYAMGSGNFGWEIMGISGNNNIKAFFSREYAGDPTLRPKLTITYAP